MDEITKAIVSKILQYLISIGSGLALAFNASIPFFAPCLIIVLIDVWAAYELGRRVAKKYPDRSDGKFKSEYKFRIMYTMFIALLGIMIAYYVDTLVVKSGKAAETFVMGVFLFYQLWSILENWSSENDNKMAHVLQKIMINKAERHFNVDLSELKKKEVKNEKDIQETSDLDE